MPKPTLVSPAHSKILTAAGISETVAKEAKVRTVMAPQDLPDGAKIGRFGPGLLFTLRHLGGKETLQLRFDEPPENEDGKSVRYMQETGTGTIITVLEEMEGRIKDAKHLLIVEGTKQTLCAASIASENTVVVGLQGCVGWVKDKKLHPDLKTLLEKKFTDVTVIFDADIASNPNVLSEAQKLSAAITDVGAPAPLFAQIPARDTGKDGLDDYLGALAEDQRFDALGNLLSTAVPVSEIKGETPLVAGSSLDAKGNLWEIDMERARITRRSVRVKDGEEFLGPRQEVMNAAGRIIKTECVFGADGVTPVENIYHLEVACQRANGVIDRSNTQVTETDMRTTIKWATLTGTPGGADVCVEPGDITGVCGAVIRAFSDSRGFVTTFPRVGWGYDWESNSAVYMMPGGSIGPAGVVTSTLGKPNSAQFASLEPSGLEKGDSEKVRQAVRDFLETRHLFANENHWLVSIGVVGLAFLPITPAAAVGFFGGPASGKTMIAQGLSSALHPKWAPGGAPMATFASTEAAFDLIASGATSTFLHVDDLTPERSPRARDRMNQGLDTLVRRAHGAGEKVRGTVNKNTGEIGTRVNADSSPLTVVTGEEVPTDESLADSALDRLLVVQMRTGQTFARDKNNPEDDGSEALERFETVATSGKFKIAADNYILYLARLINMEMGEDGKQKLSAFTEKMTSAKVATLKDEKKQFAREIAASAPSPRGLRMVAALDLGAQMFTQFAADIDAISEEERKLIERASRKAFMDTLFSGINSYRKEETDPAEEMLASIRSLVISGAASLDPAERSGSARLIGQEAVLKDGVKVVLLDHRVVASALGRGDDYRRIINTLKSVCVPDAEGKTTRKGRIGGKLCRCIAIPIEVWDGDYASVVEEAQRIIES